MSWRGEKDPAWLNLLYAITFVCGGAAVVGLYLTPPSEAGGLLRAFLVVLAIVGAAGAVAIGSYYLSRLLRSRR